MRSSAAFHIGTAVEILAVIAAGVSFFALESPLSEVLMAVFILGGMLFSWLLYPHRH